MKLLSVWSAISTLTLLGGLSLPLFAQNTGVGPAAAMPVATTPASPVQPVADSAVAPALPASSGTSPGDLVAVPSDVVPVDLINIPNTQSTTIELGFQGVISTVAPIPRVPATFIPPGSQLILRLAPALGPASNLKWFHNETQIAAGSPELVLENVARTDSGFYWATFDGNPETPSTSSLQIVVARADYRRLNNMSVRATITPQSPTATFGWVVSQPAQDPHTYGNYLIRVIGPSLANFGVANPLADPRVQFFNAQGQEIAWAETTLWNPDYEPWLREVTATAGAFPVDLSNTHEIVKFLPLPVGPTTARVSSVSGGSGEVLFEVYEILEPPPYPTNPSVVVPSS